MADAINPQVVLTIDDLRKLWAEKSAQKAILTVEDLMERWGCSRDVILEHVDNPDCPLPCLSMGHAKGGGPAKTRKLLRFRLPAVEAWEAAVERRAERPEEEAAAPKAGKPAGYTGKVYLTATGKKAGSKK